MAAAIRRAHALIPIAAAAILGTACDSDRSPPGALGPVEPQAVVVQTFHRVTVAVTDAGNTPAPAVLVTATNVNTGDYSISMTGPGGQAVLELPDGSYLIHARNLADAGPAVPLRLSLAPLPNGAGLLSTSSTEGVNRLGVLYDPNAANGVVPLDPDNYSRLTLNPPLILGGPPSSVSIALQFLTGATLNCTLVDGSGSPVTLVSTENVFVVLPHGAGPLPPVPPALANLNLPRGLLLGVATIPSGQNACALQGFNQGPNGAVIETNGTLLAGKQVVFVGSTPPSGSPSNANVTLVAEPQRSNIQYYLDPIGDAKGGQDVGLVTWGWAAFENQVSNDFVVTTRFNGGGMYILDVRWLDPNGAQTRVRVRAECGPAGCILVSVAPAALAAIVSVQGTTFPANIGLGGSINWTLNLPGVSMLEFNVLGGPASDVAPDNGALVGQNTNGGGNTWIIPGD